MSVLYDMNKNELSAFFGQDNTALAQKSFPLTDPESIHSTLMDRDEWIQTPHGLRPRECVISHDESNVIIQEMSEGLIVRYPDRKNGPKSVFYESSQKCMDNALEIRSQYEGPGGWQIFGMFHTDCLPQNGLVEL